MASDIVDKLNSESDILSGGQEQHATMADMLTTAATEIADLRQKLALANQMITELTREQPDEKPWAWGYYHHAIGSLVRGTRLPHQARRDLVEVPLYPAQIAKAIRALSAPQGREG